MKFRLIYIATLFLSTSVHAVLSVIPENMQNNGVVCNIDNSKGQTLINDNRLIINKKWYALNNEITTSKSASWSGRDASINVLFFLSKGGKLPDYGESVKGTLIVSFGDKVYKYDAQYICYGDI